MQFSTLLASALLLAGSALAQAAGNETVHVIQVGQNGNLTFSPNNVKANVGDLVQFQFWPKNHSVVQSTFAQPCTPIQNVMSNATSAFFSGFMPNNRTASGSGSNTLTYTVRVSSTAPLWFYCSQAKHCQSGMVGAINAVETGDKTVAAFAALAAQAQANLTPGQAAGEAAGTGAAAGNTTNTNNGGSSTLSTAAAGASAAATSTSSSTAAQQTTNAAPGKLLDSAKTGMAGIVGAAVVFLFL